MIVLNWFAIAAICAYRLTLGRYLAWRGLRCRHFPTCSHYGILAFQKYDFFKATNLTWKRYCDCHPASDGAFIDFP